MSVQRELPDLRAGFENGFSMLILVLLRFTNVTLAQNFHTSTFRMLTLMESERKLVEMFKDYIKVSHERINFLQRYVDRYEEFYRDSTDTPDGAVGHPIRNYLLLRRTTVDIDEIENVLLNDTVYELMYNISEMQENDELPSIEDLEGAAQGLARIQRTYQLDPLSMADGNLQNETSLADSTSKLSHKLTARDCLYLGKMEANNKRYEEGMVWYQIAKKRRFFSDAFSSLTQTEEIQSYFDDLFQMKHNDTIKPKRDTLVEKYEQLCRGENIKSSTVLKKNLFCRYFFGNHPYYLLSPVKLEILSNSPFVAILHDVLHHDEVLEFQRLAWTKMTRSLLYNPTGDSKPGSTRTSSNGWVPSSESQILRRVSVKAEMLLGLDSGDTSNWSESYQVTNYGIGGHYSPHKDYMQKPDGSFSASSKIAQSGDRIATLMYYLSDVEGGGATVFPYINLTVWPKKGSAAFWWNLKSDGSGDNLTIHGACPVLQGNKWISNKWFRGHHQIFLKKCNVKRGEPFFDL